MAPIQPNEGTSGDRPFQFPSFYSYAPYFTVQPVAETFNKQKELWNSLILAYCAHYKVHIIDVFDHGLDLFRNKDIDRHLDVGEKRVFLDALERDYNAGKGRWLAHETSQKTFFLVLWRPVEDSVMEWVEEHVRGEGHDVVLLDELVEGLGLGRWSCGEAVVKGAVETLERQKRIKVFAHKNDGKKHVGIKLMR